MRFAFLVLLSSIAPLFTYGGDQLGYISHSTINIGDDIQSIAVKQFLPENAVAVDREFISEFVHDTPVHTVVSGWFMHEKGGYWDLQVPPPEKSWPPSPMVKPFFISIHLTGTFQETVFSDENIDYLRQHAPIGARDYYTLHALQRHGIPSYFSGCLTLTLRSSAEERNDIIYLVDVDEETARYVQAKTSSPTVQVTHGRSLLQLLSPEHRLKYAEHLLDLYRKCKCVVTTRLHAAMPCLAFETPVLMISSIEPGAAEPRFGGLVEHAWHCAKSELLQGSMEYDFDHPPANPGTHLPIRENLTNIMRTWASSLAIE